MKRLLFTSMLTSIAFSNLLSAQNNFTDSGMDVSWTFVESEIIFTIKTPTTGWQAIGFNTTSALSDTYLIMGNIKNGKAELVEHYVDSPGNYKSISSLGHPQRARIIDFRQEKNSTMIKFSLPQKPSNKYQKELIRGLKYHFLYAYSLEDDFQHHSIFRSSTKINL